MHEFRDRYYREADFHFALTAIDLLKNLTYAVPRRSAMITLESRIIPTRAGPTSNGA